MDELIVISEPLRCNFCKMKVNDVVKFGPLYKLGKVKAHYFCVLLSHGLIQNGNDEEGMLGFLLKDIKEGLRKTKTSMCMYCGKKNATIICSGKKCLKKFHLPCGLENGSLHQFMKEFKSFCRNHRPVQNIPEKILKDAIQNGTICCICYERVEVTRKAEDVLWAPCCRKTWYHRYCVQKLAHSAGYFFKCAACNDTQKFKTCMERFGIYIPQQDASWERVPNAFAELLHRHDTCDAEICKCPDGRQKDEESTIFEIILCRSCGAQGVHVLCGGLTLSDPNWECDVCQAVVTKRSHSKLSPEATREIKECLAKKAGKSSSGLVNESWPPPAEEGASESKKVGTTSTDERKTDESEKGESRESGEKITEEEKEEVEALEEEIMKDQEGIIELEKEKVEEEEKEVEVLEDGIIEGHEYVEEHEKEEEGPEDGVKEGQEYVEEQEKGEAEVSVLIIEEEEREKGKESKERIEEQGQEEEGPEDGIMEGREYVEEVVEDEMIEGHEYVEEQEQEEEGPDDGIMEGKEYIEEQEQEEVLEDRIIEGQGYVEQEKGEGEVSVLIIEGEEREEEEWSKELAELQERGEADESVVIIEEEKKEEGELGKITEENVNREEGRIKQQQEREEEKWEEASVVCPTGGSFMTMKSPVLRPRKRRGSFDGLENFIGEKRRKVKITFGEEDGTENKEDEVIVDVESLSEEWKDVATQTEKTEEDSGGEEREPGEPKTSKGVDFREVIKAIKPAPLSYKISVLRKALQSSSSARHRSQSLALFPQYHQIKPGPLCYKMDMLKRVLEEKELSPDCHAEDRRKKLLRYTDIKPGPRTYKRSVVQRAGKKMTSSELKKHLVLRRRVTPTLPIPKMAIIGVEPSASTSSDYREGHLGMTSVVVDFEDISTANMDRLREEHEVELEEWDGSSEGRRTRTRRVAGGMTGSEERQKKDVSTQTNFRMRIWIMPSRSLPLRNYLRLQQKKDGSGGAS